MGKRQLNAPVIHELDVIPGQTQIIHGMPFDAYRAIRAISVHGLMRIERSPSHYIASIQAPQIATPAQQLGTLTHLCVLEHDEYQRQVRVAGDWDRRTKAGREAAAAFEAECDAIGAIVATTEQDAKVRAMREAILAQPFARALLADGIAETTLQWDDDGVACKARPDWLCHGHDVIVDLKTAVDASEAAFAKACGRWCYHMQDAWYQDAVAHCGLGWRAFVFVVVEPDPPYGVGLYQLDEQSTHTGRLRNARALETYRECIATGTWPAYTREIQTISIPKWAL